MEFDARQGFRLGDRAVYPALNRVISGGDEHTVEGKVMDVLVALASNSDGIVSKNELLDTVWVNQDVSDGVLVRAIHELRRALNDSAQDPQIIENVPRVGYRLLLPPKSIEAAEADSSARRRLTGVTIVVAAVVALMIWQFSGEDLSARPIRSVAVLPFANMTGDSRKDYVADGLTEEVIHLMAQQPSLQVAARTSSFALRDRALTIQQVASRLGVDSIVEGSVREERGMQRITVQLIHVATGAHRGSITIDVRDGDLFDAQQRIGEAIISMLRSAGADVVTELPAPTKSVNALAYDLYLKGRTALHVRSADSLQDARSFLYEAVRLDPELAQAHAALAQLYVVARYYLGLDVESATRNKRTAYAKALALDPNNIDALVVAATDAADQNDWDIALERFESVIRLQPSSAIAHLWYGQAQMMLGHMSAGQDSIATALRLDPLAGSTNIVMAYAAAIYLDDEKLLAAAKRADQFGAVLAPRFLSLYAFRQGDIDTYEQEFARSLGPMGIEPDAATLVAGAARNSAELSQLTVRLAPYGSAHINYFARDLAMLGLYTEALDALMKHPSFEGTFASDFWLPEFKPVRALPSFPKFLREIGVVEAWRTHGLPDVCTSSNPEPFCSHIEGPGDERT
jgi:TolB-like protein/DNA-binding winged helix-turn-helix (wHTH) protein/Tfp pilus assembly protein PilF